MPEYLGSQRVCRSAYAVKSATALTIYLGACERDNRPVRFEFPADMGPVATVPCFAGCTLPVRCERLNSVQTNLDCDGSCRGARGPHCACGCGGVNHGRTWGEGALLDSRELVESAIERYRAELVKITERRERRAEAAAERKRREFETWAVEHAELVTWLGTMTDDRSDFVCSMARKTLAGEILSERMIEVCRQIWRERNERAERDARREAERASKPGAGDQSALVPGVYRLGSDVYVVKGNKIYAAWRKRAAQDSSEKRPADARLYAKRLTESAPRMTDAGTEIPFELVYAPGIIHRLALSDRMPLAEAEELATRYAACIVCGRHLKAAESVRALIGPVCRQYFGPVAGEAAA